MAAHMEEFALKSKGFHVAVQQNRVANGADTLPKPSLRSGERTDTNTAGLPKGVPR
jgi:hypothetical protein